MNFRRVGLGLGLGLVLVAAPIWWWLDRRPVTLPKPPPNERAVVQAELVGNPTVSPPLVEQVHAWIFELPTSTGEFGGFEIGRRSRDALPRVGPVRTPPEVLDVPGIYVMIRRPDDKPAYIARLSDPRIVVGESFVNGEFLVDRVPGDRAAVIAARVPFVGDGLLRVFEVQGGRVTRVFLKLPFRSRPFPARGKRYRVPFS